MFSVVIFIIWKHYILVTNTLWIVFSVCLQSNTIIKSGSDLQVARHDRAHNYLSHNSPPMHNYKHKPLLPVHTTNNGSEAGSSHGSIAFIDDESSSRAKVWLINKRKSLHYPFKYQSNTIFIKSSSASILYAFTF